MKRILIVQNVILHYRKVLYNELAKSYKITILHSGKKSVEENDRYEELICKKKKLVLLFINMA